MKNTVNEINCKLDITEEKSIGSHGYRNYPNLNIEEKNNKNMKHISSGMMSSGLRYV